MTKEIKIQELLTAVRELHQLAHDLDARIDRLANEIYELRQEWKE